MPGAGAIHLFFRFINGPTITLFVTVIVTVFALNQHGKHAVRRVVSVVKSSVNTVTVVIFVVTNNNTFGRMLMSDNIKRCVSRLVAKAALSPLLVY